ncbi:SIMPL domain-containing protein [Maricaulis sp.]|uniref:SIMPL domain-containing protein n=1 Tax=Maricaulis sp. TaxID=1486257 RepID=UPI003A902470
MIRALLASTAFLIAASPALADEVNPTLSLSASADVQVAPDYATVQSGVVTRAATAQQAMQDNARVMTAVFEALRRAGVTGNDVQTSQLSVTPVYADRSEPRQNQGQYEIIAYETRNTVTAKVRDTARVGNAIDAMVSAGANNIQDVSFGAEDTSDAMDQARREAIASLLARADLFADAAGFELCGITRMGEDFARPAAPMMMARMDSASTPVAAGQLSVTATINADFCISDD